MKRTRERQWLSRIGCALKQKDWGVSGLDQKVLNSSQGTPKRTDRECRMRHATGSSSIQFFHQFFHQFFLQFFFLAMMALGLPGVAMGMQENHPLQDKASMSEQYRQVGDAYESMMMQHFYGQLKGSQDIWTDKDSPFAPSNGEKIFQSMYDQLIMENVAKRRPLGVSDLVVQQLEGKGGVRTRPRVNYSE